MYSFEGRAPTVDPGAFIAPTATLVGDVHVEAGASVWFNAVLRADFAPIIVREGANVQDCCVLHAPPGIPVDVGPGATVLTKIQSGASSCARVFVKAMMPAFAAEYGVRRAEPVTP